MPVIRVEMFSGRTVEQKRDLAQALTTAFIETAGGTPDSVQIVMTDIEKENWAVAGKLLSEPAAD